VALEAALESSLLHVDQHAEEFEYMLWDDSGIDDIFPDHVSSSLLFTNIDLHNYTNSMVETTEDDPEHDMETTTMLQPRHESTSDHHKLNGVSSLPATYVNLLYVYAPSNN
jgi:hypothetical protein